MAFDDHDLYLEVHRRKMEDAFFQENDKKLIENLKKLKNMKETSEALAKVSGIHNEKVLQKLVELEVRPETLASLSVIPLVEMAWADGSLSKEEEAAVLTAAAGMGIKTGSVEHNLLKEWLANKPPATMLTAWVHYVEGLCEKLTATEKSVLKKEILGDLEKVANASGGLLGLGAISKAEKDMLKKMEKAFGC
jgi:hypothetical protein